MGALPDWFMAKVAVTGSCWLWQGARSHNGYGRVRDRRVGKVKRAHRVAWEMANGAIPEGKLLLHICDVRECVNPAHLRPGTHLDNTQDMVTKGRARNNPKRGAQHAQAKLTEEQALVIRNSRGAIPGATLAARYGISRDTIYAIWGGRLWSHL